MDQQAFGLDPVVEDSGAASQQRLPNGCLIAWVGDTKETPASSGAAHLRRTRTRRKCGRNQRLNQRRRHAGRKFLTGVPLEVDLRAEALPIPGGQRLAYA